VKQSLDAERDLRTLMASQILFWMLRAPDGHAKNFSIQLQAGMAGRFRLTPMYDVMSAYPVIGAGPNQWVAQDLKLAMALLGKNRHYHMHHIQRRHFNSTARKVGYGENAESLLQELVARTPEVVAQVHAELPPGFSQEVADKVLGGLLSAARALEAMPMT
jgi:serine/threonine-protein kinase HipA